MRIEKTFYVPSMTSQASAVDVEEALEDAPGIDEFKADSTHHVVRVVMVDPEGEADIIRRLHDAGFPVEEREED